jgi:hypothetical protein
MLFFFLTVGSGLKAQRNTINAVPESRRWRTVLEHVAEMSTALTAVHFGTNHSEAAIGGRRDRALERCEKAGPPGPALELPLGSEERLATTGTTERSWTVLTEESTRSGRLSRMLPQHGVLLGRQ